MIDLPPPRASLPILLILARETMLRELRPMMADAGLTEPQWRILRVLTHEGALSVQDVAAAACLQPTSVSRILQSMVERGLVLRRQDSANRRRQVVTATAQGQALIARSAPVSRAVTDGFADRFGRERYAQLVALLDAFIVDCGEG
ncbi:hypothetical protein AL036_09405 [Salipiger aestuarii]|uniref:Homoprotocatechuate degradation regulator HpaR n=1 Tax=Salipiger aestuarii TaxID=568098 RepID=A0A327XYW2_9RHOB|nr:MarR family transcriptional regulator [Salipiger aestuarii]EIE51308.1 MarR family transcriptional regulator [Citreicella sp. 357]KAA8607838.1 hypothetical protein AL036_09405 [Salipiger aestuarii]KAA8610512.1 hypothetical protein AL037_13480 [Salipiger aestuarii]KAB2541082.1 hypothetical protein AL035_14000 [Salipiger aestuarii]RAK13341.1 homoprotocatechuate degradation regulator HpaR [Salipiger aestuarii]